MTFVKAPKRRRRKRLAKKISARLGLARPRELLPFIDTVLTRTLVDFARALADLRGE